MLQNVSEVSKKKFGAIRIQSGSTITETFPLPPQLLPPEKSTVGGENKEPTTENSFGGNNCGGNFSEGITVELTIQRWTYFGGNFSGEKMIRDPVRLSCFRCKVCAVFLETRNQFLIHLQGHEADNSTLFHTATGLILRIHELPHTYDLFRPKIQLKPLEDTCSESTYALQVPQMKLPNLTEDQIKDINEESNKRQLRVKPKRSYSFGGDEEGEILYPESSQKRKSRDNAYRPGPDRQKRRPIPLAKTEIQIQARSTGLSCNFCDPKLEFESGKSCMDHMREAHYKDGRFRCPYCSFVTRINMDFRIHICGIARTRRKLGQKVLECRVCSPILKFQSQTAFLTHMNERHKGDDGKYACSKCSRKTLYVYRINRHMISHESGRRSGGWKHNREYPCTSCPKSFPDLTQLKSHLKSHLRSEERNRSKAFRCNICKVGFTMQANLQRHILHKHTENNPYACKFPGCKVMSGSRNSYSRHVLLHFENLRVLPCDICGLEYTRQDRLVYHKKSAHGVGIAEGEKLPVRPRYKKPQFRLARVAIPTPPQPNLPAEVHKQAVLPKIEVPDSNSNRINLGSLHLGDPETIKEEAAEALKDADEELAVVATRSGPIRTIDKGLLESHPVAQQWAAMDPEFVQMVTGQRRHTNSGDLNSFPCTICKFPKVAYSRIHFLRTHMLKVHPEQKATVGGLPSSAAILTLTCSSCGFQCSTASDLAEHMDSLHKDRKWPCTICGVGCRSQVGLDLHKARNHYAKPTHNCSLCPKSFTRNYYLQRHVKQAHAPLPEDPNDLICKDCGKKTSSLRALKEHVKLHSKSRELSYCGICSSKLSCPASLRRHIQLIHLGYSTSTSGKDEGKVTAESQVESSPPADLFL